MKLDSTPACCRDPRLEEAQRSHTQELANLTRLMQHKIDAIKKDCWEKQLKINELDVRIGGCREAREAGQGSKVGAVNQ